MKIKIIAVLALGLAYTSLGQDAGGVKRIPTADMSMTQDSLMFRKIAGEIMLHSTCYENLRVLCKTVGHRISGSPAAAKAVIWGEKAMKEAGADKVWLQAADVPYWCRGKESLYLKIGGEYTKVDALSLGSSTGTGGKTLEAPVIMVHNFDEFSSMPESAVKGKIVFFDYRFRQDLIFTFEGYGDAVRYRGQGPSLAAKKGAVAVIIRSMSTGKDDFPHTGGTRPYTDSVKTVPSMALGNATADRLEEACMKGNVSAKMTSECRNMPDLVHSNNVIGEITGSEHPEQIITIGGHLDSWDVGEGANDDGAGCVQSIEVIRAFKALGIRPKCTIRAVLFMNEENGQKGGRAYADSAEAKHEQHILVMETDAGGFSPRGIGLVMSDARKAKIMGYRSLFLPYGVYDFSKDEGGSDIEPIHEKLKVPMAGLVPDSQRYFDIHHTNNDVFENVNHRELELGAAVLTQFIWLVSERGLN
jgi:carboxypeptidase Q